MVSVVIAIHLMLILALIGVVLLQKSEGGGLVSTTSGFMTGRGTANLLTRTTALLAAGFFLTSLALSLLAAHSRESISLIPSSTHTQQAPAPGSPPPVAPFNSGKNGLLNQLGGGANGNAKPAANAPATSGPAAQSAGGAGAAAASKPASSGAPASSPASGGPQVPQSH
jgi:preprotein translocase subunit SecG